jgi:hypothetical protein
MLVKPRSLEEYQEKYDAFFIEYDDVMNRMVNSLLFEGEAWEKAREEEFEELQSTLDLYLAEYTALIGKDYSKLRMLPWHVQNPLLERYVAAFTGTDEQMIEMFEEHTKRMAEKNGDPQRIINNAKDVLEEENWRELATINMLTYGWHNEANDGIKRHDEYDTFFDLFLPLFENLEYTDCCEP